LHNPASRRNRGDVGIHDVPINIHDLDRREFAEHSIFVFDIADLRHPCPSWFQ
jgi:hypothetical protein